MSNEIHPDCFKLLHNILWMGCSHHISHFHCASDGLLAGSCSHKNVINIYNCIGSLGKICDNSLENVPANELLRYRVWKYIRVTNRSLSRIAAPDFMSIYQCTRAPMSSQPHCHMLHFCYKMISFFLTFAWLWLLMS